jgi:hypothetical protein
MLDFESSITSLFITLIVIVIGFFTFGNFESITKKITIGNIDDIDDSDDPDSVLEEIFYLYNHNSEKDWLKWIKQQSSEMKQKAAALLCAHLESQPKQWGVVTLEAIECLREFKDYDVDKRLSEFIKKITKIWQEYKSIPNYYEKAINVLTAINPDIAINSYSVEFEKNIESQAVLERKKILLNQMPALEEKSKDLLINILTNHNENFIIKPQALRTCLKLNKETKKEIFLEALKRVVKKQKSLNRSLKAEEMHLTQDLIREGVMLIGNKNFFDILQEACQSFQLQRLILDAVIAYFNSEFSQPRDLDYYAASLLKDSTHNDLKMYLAKRVNLTEKEMNNLIFKPTLEKIDIEDLKNNNSDLYEFPVPDFLKERYETFKAAFFKNIEDFDIVTSEKIFGGVLATGDSAIEKLYFAQALAKEKKWNFGYIDIATITSRESYSSNISIFSTLRKPYLLYIKNPELFFIKSDSDEGGFREKFAQSLAIQSLDSKSYLLGDINCKIEETNFTSLGEAIKSLKYKYFPQSVEINQEEGPNRYTIAMKFLQSLEPYRIESHKDFCDRITILGSELNDIEFIFFIMRTLSSMLLVFGKVVSYEEFERLESRFLMNNDNLSLKLENNTEEDSDDNSDVNNQINIVTINLEEETIINIDQVEQTKEQSAPIDS